MGHVHERWGHVNRVTGYAVFKSWDITECHSADHIEVVIGQADLHELVQQVVKTVTAFALEKFTATLHVPPQQEVKSV